MKGLIGSVVLWMACGYAHAASLVIECDRHDCISDVIAPVTIEVTRGKESRIFVLNSTMQVVCDEMQICRRAEDRYFVGEAPAGQYTVSRGYRLAVDNHGKVIAYQEDETDENAYIGTRPE